MTYGEQTYEAPRLPHQRSEADAAILAVGARFDGVTLLERHNNFVASGFDPSLPSIGDIPLIADVIEMPKARRGIVSKAMKTVAGLVVTLGSIVPAHNAIADGEGSDAPPVAAGGRATVTIPGKGNRTALINTTITQTQGLHGGYNTWLQPSEQPGLTASVNTDAQLQTRASMSIVKLGADGGTTLFTQTGAHLIADLQGFFAPNAFNDIPDYRLTDTRQASGEQLAPGTFTELAGEPGKTAAVILAATDTSGAGYVQVLSEADLSKVGKWSNLNVDAAGQTKSILTFVKFNAQGKAYLFNQNKMNLVADNLGYMQDGAFDDIEDTRVLDTRGGAKPAPNSTTKISGGRPNSTAVLSVIDIDTSGPGYVQVAPTGQAKGQTSSGNASKAGEIVPMFVIVKFDGNGQADILNQMGGHLVADIQGYFADWAFEDVDDVRVLDTRIQAPVEQTPAAITYMSMPESYPNFDRNKLSLNCFTKQTPDGRGGTVPMREIDVTIAGLVARLSANDPYSGTRLTARVTEANQPTTTGSAVYADMNGAATAVNAITFAAGTPQSTYGVFNNIRVRVTIEDPANISPSYFDDLELAASGTCTPK